MLQSCQSVLCVAYVLRSFPEPSETFVADEIASLPLSEVHASVISVRAGRTDVVHASASRVLSARPVLTMSSTSRKQAVLALLRLFANAPLRTSRIALHTLGSAERWYMIQSLPAAAWCVRRKVNMLHSHFADVNLRYAAAISRWIGKPYGVTTHRYDITDDPLGQRVTRDLLLGASVIVTISEFNRKLMARKYGLDEAAIRIIRCGVDLSRFTYAPRRKLSVDEPIRILNVGRLVSIKAHDVLFSALALVRQQGVAFRVDVVGDGDLHQPLVQQVQSLGLGDVVRFHGAQAESKVRELLAAADLFVLSSRSEGLPVACIEAMASGTPVVATRITGIPELISDGLNGWLVPPDDVEALAIAIVDACRNPGLRARFSSAGRATVEAGFDRVGCTRQLVDAWLACVTGSGG